MANAKTAARPTGKDANRAPNTPTTAKHADTVGKPMQPCKADRLSDRADLKGGMYVPTRNGSVDGQAAATYDPKIEYQDSPALQYPGPHSRDGLSDLESAEFGTSKTL